MQANTIVLAAMSLAPGLLYGQFDLNSRSGRPDSQFRLAGFCVFEPEQLPDTKNQRRQRCVTDFGINISTPLTDKLASGLSFTTGTSGNSAIGVPA